jgi:hypothetical protein
LLEVDGLMVEFAADQSPEPFCHNLSFGVGLRIHREPDVRLLPTIQQARAGE